MSLDTLKLLRQLFQAKKTIIAKGGQFLIAEGNRLAKLRQLRIDGVGSEAFQLLYDKCGFPNEEAFALGLELHKGCDAVAFCLVNNQPFILCCELKSSKPTVADAAKQFRSVHCFLEYLEAVLSSYYPGHSLKEWNRRYFVFHAVPTPLLMQPHRPDFISNNRPDAPRFMHVVNNEAIYANHLLGVRE